MTKKKNFKTALVMAILSLIVCLSMFAGTTFAWFTDSVTSSNNIIKAGNLDVELYYQQEGQSGWTQVTSETNVFMKDALWEPGHTEVVKLKVVNEGSLALKYNLGVNLASEVGSVNVNNKEFKLSDFIKFAIVDGAQSYTRDQAIAAAEANGATALKTAYNSTVTALDAKNATDSDEKIVTMVVYMPTTVGNDANAKPGAAVPTINLGINLFATQYTFESDSFDNQYDKGAIIVTNAAEAQAALDSAEAGATIKLAPGVNYGTLVFGRNASNKVVDISSIGGDSTGNERYSRYENITILGAAGATVDQITFDNGREDANAIWNYIDVKNLTIKNVTFSGASIAVKIPDGFAIAIDGLSLVNCKMIDTEGNDRFVYQPHSGYKTMNDKTTGEYVMTSGVKNLTITGCEITGAKQVIEARAMENLTITNNTFNGIKSRDILLSRDSNYPDVYYTGTITITGNTSINGEERFVRMAGAGSANVVVKDNVINNYYGEDQDYIKVTDLNGGTLINENNVISFAWNGNVPASKPESLVVDTTAKTISINSIPAFAYLNTLVNDSEFYNNYGSKWQYTIELNTDVDLKNHAWTPILLSNFVAFEGNNHTISNLKVDTTENNAGLFADIKCNDIGVTYVRDLNIDGAYVKGNNSVGVLAGLSTQGVIENVTINNATVIGNKYVGGVFGWGNGSVNNSTVKNSKVTIPEVGAKEAGGLVGYLSNDGKSSTVNKVIAGNTVENVTIVAPTIASGLISQPNSSNIGGAVIEVVNNEVKNVTIITSDNTASLYVSNNVSGKTIVKNNTATDCKVGREVYGLTLFPNGENSKIIVSDKEGFLNLTKLFADWTALFTDGNGTTYTNYANGAGADYYYAGRWTVSLEADIDLNNDIIDPVIIKHPVSAGTPAFDGNGYMISNAKIAADPTTENEAGLFYANYVSFKNLKLDNIHVTGSNVGGSTAGILSGSCNALVDNITITNSSVTGGKYTGGVVGCGYTSVTNCTLTNVTVKGGYKLGGLIGYICASGTNTGDVTGNTLTDCTVDGIGGGVYAGGKDKYVIGKVVGNYNCNGTCNNNTVTNMITSATENIGEIEAGKTVTQ